ncbi:MAG: CHRD domain-containing protein [Dehalococcoidia bacterium]|nr:CHRD domain-containing protein [Dehalococcoidia bacterium]
MSRTGSSRSLGWGVTALVALVLAAGLAVSLGQPARAADQSVAVIDFSFQPSNVTVNVGDEVTWTNNGAVAHTVTAAGGQFDSGTLSAGASFAHTFTAAGTFNYHCDFHPSMVGVVTVLSGTVTATATSTATATATGTATATSTATATPTTATATPTTATATPTTAAATPTTATATPTTATATTTGTPSTPISGGTTLTLTGAEEVPPVTSPVTGTFQFRLDGQTVHWRLLANGNGETLTMAHFHLGAKGVNGPIVVTLFMGDRATTDVTGTVTAASLQGPLAGNLQGFLDALKAGNLYVNVHTTTNPAGAIRAQVPATPPAAPSTGSGVGADDAAAPWLPLALAGPGLAATAVAATWALRRR